MKFTTALPIFILLAHDALAMPWLDNTGIQPRSDGCLTACWHGEKLKAIPCIVKCFFGSSKKGAAAADQSTDNQQDTTTTQGSSSADQGSDDDGSSSDEETQILQHGDIVQCFWDCMATFEQMGLYWGDATGDKIRTNCVNACRH
ncbi:hypothetical protein F5X96DRAFT_694822 [Biscogniauxia mediterranea]|nr:hypothetical protein F5X96DRAFT_694822 [Biscogniauxia mediterranea]